MSSQSDIEWTDTTWNPVAGCAKVSAGCKHCYAETMAARHALMSAAQGRTSPYLPVVDAERRRWRGNFVTLPERLADPLSWRKPRRVFVNSMSDLFGEGVPFEYIAAVFGLMAATPRHTYQVLTKRPARMVEFFEHTERFSLGPLAYCRMRANPYVEEAPGPWPLPNVWLGVSAEDQATADERIPLLLQVPAAVRFISAEPLLGPIELHHEWLVGRILAGGAAIPAARAPALDWIIVGGESGPGARRCDLTWLRDVVRSCSAAGVDCFVKQVGAHPTLDGIARGQARGTFVGDTLARITNRKGADPSEWPEYLRIREWPHTPSL